MVKRIAIFCDGTWNRHDAAHPTNAVRLAQAVKPVAGDGMTQVVQYVLGLGAGRGAGWLLRTADRVLGGALGWGLTENVEEAYRALVFTYEPGDHLYLFGFSRGAYTARSLAGLIRACGIPPAGNLHLIGEAIARYRTRGRPETHPDNPASFLFRADFAPFTVTSAAEWDWRQQHRPGFCHRLAIAYLGVWDTVGALGIPGHWGAAPWLNARHQFHDTRLSRLVRAARHAVAVDEARQAFVPTLWSNRDALNREALRLPEAADLVTVGRDRLPYREEWFPGDHGSVGGGGARRGLSALALGWVAEGAAAQGLDLRPAAMGAIRAEGNLHEALCNHPEVGAMHRLMRRLGRPRAGPKTAQEVAAVTRARMRADPGYRPAPLAPLHAALLRD